MRCKISEKTYFLFVCLLFFIFLLISCSTTTRHIKSSKDAIKDARGASSELRDEIVESSGREEERNKQIEKTSGDISKSSDDLKGTSEELTKSINEFRVTIERIEESGEGRSGEAIIHNIKLREGLRELDELLELLRVELETKDQESEY